MSRLSVAYLTLCFLLALPRTRHFGLSTQTETLEKSGLSSNGAAEDLKSGPRGAGADLGSSGARHPGVTRSRKEDGRVQQSGAADSGERQLARSEKLTCLYFVYLYLNPSFCICIFF